MTIAQRILELLQRQPQGLDDDQIAEVLSLKVRQQANSRCRQLQKEGYVTRRPMNGKIRNFSTERPIPVTVFEANTALNQVAGLWFWEGNVQAQVVQHLTAQNYQIRSVADTARRQQGVDIIADRDGEQLWVSVKGYPVGTSRTNPSVQAGHWFKQAIFDVLDYRGQDSAVSLGVGLPDYPRYRSLARKISWFKPVGGFRYFWVEANGQVIVE